MTTTSKVNHKKDIVAYVEKAKEAKLVEFDLPAFPGFYGTWYEDFLWDYDHVTTEEMTKYIFDAVKEAMLDAGLFKSLEYEKLRSPRYYNYTTDAIEVSGIINVEAFNETISDNIDAFNNLIKDNLTSYDGFSSYYTPEPSLYFKEGELTEYALNEHAIMTLITGFVFEHETSLNEVDIYNEATEGIY